MSVRILSKDRIMFVRFKFRLLLGVQVSHKTVFYWIKKYTALMEKYLDKITPQVSDTWRADELFLKVKGNMKYMYAMMDDQTRFWIAQEVADTKYTADVRPLLQLAKQVAGKQPKSFITNGAANFHEAYLQEFYTKRLETRTEHIRHIRLAGDHNNSRMERFNGEVGDREKVMRWPRAQRQPNITGLSNLPQLHQTTQSLRRQNPSRSRRHRSQRQRQVANNHTKRQRKATRL